MCTATKRVIKGLLLAVAISRVAGVAHAGKGNPQAGGRTGSNNGAMYGPGTAAGHGGAQPAQNQFQHRYRHQHRQQKGQGNAWSGQSGGNAGQGIYSDDRRLSQQDFQVWLNQSGDALKSRNQHQYRELRQEQPGL